MCCYLYSSVSFSNILLWLWLGTKLGKNIGYFCVFKLYDVLYALWCMIWSIVFAFYSICWLQIILSAVFSTYFIKNVVSLMSKSAFEPLHFLLSVSIWLLSRLFFTQIIVLYCCIVVKYRMLPPLPSVKILFLSHLPLSLRLSRSCSLSRRVKCYINLEAAWINGVSLQRVDCPTSAVAVALDWKHFTPAVFAPQTERWLRLPLQD